MSLDTEPIRKRLAHIDPDFWWDACAPDEDDTVPSDSEFARHAPQDIAALLSEVDRLTAENEALRADLARAKTLLESTRRQCDHLAERLQRFDLLDLPY